MLLKVDCLPNVVWKQSSIPLNNLGRKWTLSWWWWWWWWWSDWDDIIGNDASVFDSDMHDILWSKQLCIPILSFLITSKISVEFVISFFFLQLQCLLIHQQTWILQFIILWHNSQAIPKIILLHKTPKTLLHLFLRTFQNFNISHQYSKNTLTSRLPITQGIDYKLCLLTYKTLTNK